MVLIITLLESLIINYLLHLSQVDHYSEQNQFNLSNNLFNLEGNIEKTIFLLLGLPK